LDDKDD